MVSLRVGEQVAVLPKARWQTAVNRQKPIVFGLHKTLAWIDDVAQRVVGRLYTCVDGPVQVVLGSVHARDAHQPAGQACFAANDRLRRVRTTQIAIDSTDALGGAAGTHEPDQRPTLAVVECAVGVRVVPAIEASGRRGRIAEGEIIERKPMRVPRKTTEQ